MTSEPISKFANALRTKDIALLTFAIFVFLIGNHAGSMVAAAAAAIGGLFGVIGHPIAHPRRWPVAVWIGFTFLGWCALSALWSPYESPRAMPGVMRYCLGLPMYGLLIYVMLKQSEGAKTIYRLLIVSLAALSACVFAIDFISDYKIYRLVKPDALNGDIIMNLSHGLSVLLMCLAPILIFLARQGRGGKMLALACIIFTVLAAANSGNTAAMIAVPLIFIFMYAGRRFSRASLRLVLILPVAAILLAPVLSIFASELSQTSKDALPFSWEWRAETWAYLAEKIMQHPIIGNGFDSLRTMKDTFDARGFEGLSYVPLHAHNFGLQIWVEVGLVGALLAALFFWEAGAALSKSKWLTPTRSSALCAVIVTAVVFSSLSYSAWQDWWWGAIAFALSFVTLIPDNA